MAEQKEIKDSGQRTEFDSGAVRDMKRGVGRMDLLPACAVIRLSKHFEAGAVKYEERNWEKGIPIHSFIDSAIRHLMKYLDGQDDEDHLCAAAWNCMCAMWTEEKMPEMQDIPARMNNTNLDYDMCKVIEQLECARKGANDAYHDTFEPYCEGSRDAFETAIKICMKGGVTDETCKG